MKKLAVTLVLAFATVTAACGSDDPTPTSSSSSSGTSGTTPVVDSGTPVATANEVIVKSNEFVPKTITVKVGDEVTFKWTGGTHNVVSGANCMADATFTSGNPVGTVGNTFKQKFATAGSFEYFCDPHCVSSGMKGTVVVQ